MDMQPSGAPAAGILGCIIMAVTLLVGLAAFAFWLWMLIDCAKNCPSENNTKLVWVLIIIFAQVIGALIYYFVQRPKNMQAMPPPPA